ncbi:nucleoside deaminase [Commensalibacter sp. Nvir]|uniref:nucleoside deaminase n=1 Tax=Commensalibacter sp. Nvir TaxID=3069817 RepID=UPI0030C7BA46
MREALKCARMGLEKGEVPVGALVLSPTKEIIASSHNYVETLQDPTAHAEILALKQASKLLKRKYLKDCTLVVTLEPCPLCASAAMLYRVGRIVFGAYDPKGGGIEHGARIFNRKQTLHRPEIIGGVEEHVNKQLLKEFFTNLR